MRTCVVFSNVGFFFRGITREKAGTGLDEGKSGANEALNRKSDNKRDLFLYTLKLHKKYEKHDRIHISY